MIQGEYDKEELAEMHAIAQRDMERLQYAVEAIIERCAQVAESFHAYDRPANEIAAAIRALKDKL